MNHSATSTDERIIAIIGYGVAGVNTAIALRTAGYAGRILVFSDTGIPPYSPILTSYYAGGKKSYDECFPWSAEELAALDLDVRANTPVVELDPTAHLIRTADGEFAYDKCVIAAGSTPMPYGFPGVEGEPDYQPIMLRTMDDAERLRATAADPACKRILVSGASMVALKTLEAFLDHGLDCTLVGMNPHVLDMNALPATAERFERGLREKGVTLRLGQTIQHVKRIDDPSGFEGRRLEVTFSTGDVDTFDEISVAHGMKSNFGFVKAGSLETDRALLVDEFMRTSDPDVYAAGDVVQATELISGTKMIVGIWKNAALQGACAGRAIAAEMAGEQPPADCALAGSIATNTIAVNGTLFISAGTMALTDDRWVEERETDDMTVVYVYENTPDGGKRLVGFNITCDDDTEGSPAFDTGAMLTLRIEHAFAQ